MQIEIIRRYKSDEKGNEINTNRVDKEEMNLFNPYLTGEYPNWWGTMPMAMFTFLERYDLSGKKIIPFCTNEGSRMGSSEHDLKNLCWCGCRKRSCDSGQRGGKIRVKSIRMGEKISR